MHVRDSSTAHPPTPAVPSVSPPSAKAAWTDSAHLAAGAEPKTDRHDALRALHERLAKTERHVQDLLHAAPLQD